MQPVFEKITLSIHLDLEEVDKLSPHKLEVLQAQVDSIASMAQTQAQAWLIEQWPTLSPFVETAKSNDFLVIDVELEDDEVQEEVVIQAQFLEPDDV